MHLKTKFLQTSSLVRKVTELFCLAQYMIYSLVCTLHSIPKVNLIKRVAQVKISLQNASSVNGYVFESFYAALYAIYR